MKKAIRFLFICLLALAALNACSPPRHVMERTKKRMIEQYSDPSNYIYLQGTILEIEDAYPPRGMPYRYEIKLDEGLYDYDSITSTYARTLTSPYFWTFYHGCYDHPLDLKVGDTVQFSTSLGIWDQGLREPIVSLRKNDTIYYEFEEGQQELLYWVENLYIPNWSIWD